MLPVISTFKANTVNLFNPDPETICIEDIAHHLSLINRFNGSTIRPYSVAAHSLYIAEHLVPPELAFQALMHDANEAYLGDVVKPLKVNMPEYVQIEERFWRVIADKYGLPYDLDERVHKADQLACMIEHRQLRTGGSTLQLEHQGGVVGAASVSFDDWERVKWKFLDKFLELAP